MNKKLVDSVLKHYYAKVETETTKKLHNIHSWPESTYSNWPGHLCMGGRSKYNRVPMDSASISASFKVSSPAP